MGNFYTKGCNSALKTPPRSDITPICELITELDFNTDFDLITEIGGFHRTLQRVRLANRGRLLLRTPGPVPFGTCIYSYVETILSLTCYVYGPFEFRTSLGTSILLRRQLAIFAWIACYLSVDSSLSFLIQRVI